jgi:PAS domain S-box-containing protein
MLQGLREQDRHRPSNKLGSTQRLIPSVVLAAIVAIVYFLSARLSLVLLTNPDGVAVFWPAAGLASGILIALGPKARAPVAVGTIIATICANLVSDRDLGLATVSALSNAGEALLVAWLIEHNFGSNFALDDVRRVFGLVMAGTLSAALSGIVGTAGFIWFHHSSAPVLTIWQHWFASDALGVLAIAPVLIGLASVIRNPPPLREVIEALAAIVTVVVTVWLAVFKLRQPWAVIVPGALLYPIQLTLAARCQPFFGALTALIVTLGVVCTITFGLGQFFAPDVPMQARILAAQASILVASLSMFVLSALFAERRQHEAVITESESRMRAIVNTVVDGIITIDEEGTIGNLNPAAGHIFGYDPEELVGRNVRMLMPEPFRSEHDGYLSNYLTTGQAKIIGKGREVTGERKDGSVFPIDLAISEMNVAGRTMFTGVVRDITERKRAEDALLASKEELQAVLNQTPFMLVRCSRDLRYRFISEAYARWLDLPRGEVLGATIKETIGNEAFNMVRPYIEQVLQGLPVDFECEREFRGVGRRWLNIAYRPELDAAGNVEGWIASLFDVTERKRADEHQVKLVAELDHRVKNILAQVAAVASSTRGGSRSIDEFLGSLDGRIRSMAIAHTLLSATGWRSVGLKVLATNLLTPYATGTNVTISGTDVVLDAAEIQAVTRVLHELATNAAKYGALSIPSGQISVSWELKPNGAATNLSLVWRELGGPAVVSEHPPGYGTTLIRNLIPYELGGAVDLAFEKEGVNCRMEIPVRRALAS